jgi:hypothetical protein
MARFPKRLWSRTTHVLALAATDNALAPFYKNNRTQASPTTVPHRLPENKTIVATDPSDSAARTSLTKRWAYYLRVNRNVGLDAARYCGEWVEFCECPQVLNLGVELPPAGPQGRTRSPGAPTSPTGLQTQSRIVTRRTSSSPKFEYALPLGARRSGARMPLHDNAARTVDGHGSSFRPSLYSKSRNTFVRFCA